MRRCSSLLVVMTAALTLVACSGDGADGASATTAPETTVVVETTAPARTTCRGRSRPVCARSTSGQCFDTIDDARVTDLAVWLLDCAEPHTYEVYDVVTYEGDGAGRGTSYPGVATVQDWSEQACYDRFEAFVGVRWTISELDIAVWWPSEESWARADRSVICTVMSDTGDELTGTQRDIAR